MEQKKSPRYSDVLMEQMESFLVTDPAFEFINQSFRDEYLAAYMNGVDGDCAEYPNCPMTLFKAIDL